ncbi:MAG: hypothetical protein PF488_01815 [Patescibacteria group bacterium]|jgi:hypothetical protein|nr:hypothetical protein [Patescibacteria group bacterium]
MKSTLISESCPELVLIKQSKEALSVEQRLEINPKVREMLAVADNGIIIYAAIMFHHDLAFRELKKRIEGDRFNDLEELFYLMDRMYPDYHGKAHNKVFSLTWQRIITVSKSKPTEEIVNIIKEYGCHAHLLGDDLTIIDDILEDRNDLDEITNILSSLGFKPEELSLTLRDRPRN